MTSRTLAANSSLFHLRSTLTVLSNPNSRAWFKRLSSVRTRAGELLSRYFIVQQRTEVGDTNWVSTSRSCAKCGS